MGKNSLMKNVEDKQRYHEYWESQGWKSMDYLKDIIL